MADKTIAKREESLRVFNQAASMYDRIGPAMFSYFGQRLIDTAEIPNGANVLDVAAGRGALLFPAAARVGPTGHVTGIDFAPNMVRETAKVRLALAVGEQLDDGQLDDEGKGDRFNCAVSDARRHIPDRPGGRRVRG